MKRAADMTTAAGGRAVVRGDATPVAAVVEAKLASGQTPEELQARFPHLTLAEIYAALAHYYAEQQGRGAETAGDGAPAAPPKQTAPPAEVGSAPASEPGTPA